ncbi:hypothetical protein BD410DRAFT_437924 [Rickenella mellea]|uniref:Uncharacterized protein n=1 Tax=Rickenella mellea TaxID=50990 RepID=A0A4Y7PYA5_9AGAM|nr:hypothetical protein BD410DRAFT_213977 [Rickenella mellea]TDL19520.1 hypothetical protein BD410DRAFT_437924 [Rickenella mellea]
MADLAASHDAEHLVGPLLVALVLSWVLFAVLSIQVWSLFVSGSARPRDAAVVDHLGFASAAPPTFRGGLPYDGSDFDPYVYPPYSPISDGSTRPGSQQFSFPTRRQGSPMPLGTGPPPHPRLPHERGTLKTLVCAIYALQFLSSVLVTIYTWRQIVTGWGDLGRLHGSDGVWLQIVAADIIGPLVFSLSFQFFAYRIFLLTPIPGNERSPTIHKSLKLKPFHSFHHSRNLPVWVYSLPAFVSSMSAIFGICALVNGAQLLNHPVPLGYSFPLNATGYVWLIGDVLINLTTFTALLILVSLSS